MAARRRLPTGAQDTIPMPLSFPTTEHLQESWGRPPWSAADAPIGLLAFCMMLISLLRLRDEGVPRRQTSNPSPLTVVASNFGIFAVDSAGVGPGIVTDFVSAASQPVNALNSVAVPGQVITIWGTGLGGVPSDVVPPSAGNLAAAAAGFRAGRCAFGCCAAERRESGCRG